MRQMKKKYFFFIFLIVTQCSSISGSWFSWLWDSSEVINPNQSHDDKMKQTEYLKKLQELKKLERDNSKLSRMGNNIGDKLLEGSIKCCSDIVSGYTLERAKRELDILYDGRPTTAVKLTELSQGLVIINSALTALIAVSDRISQPNSGGLGLTEKEIKDVGTRCKKDLVVLEQLRNEHVDQLIEIRRQRNPHFELTKQIKK